MLKITNHAGATLTVSSMEEATTPFMLETIATTLLGVDAQTARGFTMTLEPGEWSTRSGVSYALATFNFSDNGIVAATETLTLTA